MVSLFGDGIKPDDNLNFVSDNTWVQWMLRYRLVFVKLLMIYFFFMSMFAGLVCFCLTYVFFDRVFVDYQLTDIGFHLDRIININHAFNLSNYYSPLFHILINTFAWGRNPILALAFFIPFMVYFLLPMAVYSLAKNYHGGNTLKGIFSALVYFFGVNSTFYITTGTYPQALNALLVCVMLYFAFDLFKGVKGSLFGLLLFTLFGFFSHPEGGFFCVLILIVALILNRSFILSGVFIGLLYYVLTNIQFLFRRGANMLSTIPIIQRGILGMVFFGVIKLLYYTNYPAVILGIYGFGRERKDYLLLFCILFSVLCSPFDSQLRPYLYAMMFLCIPAGGKLFEFLEKEDYITVGVVLGTASIWWTINTIFHVVVLLIHFYLQSL